MSGIVTVMPITTSAKKQLRASAKKRVFNMRRLETMRDAIKLVKKSATPDALSKAYQAIDKAAKSGVIKKNHAARRKSRLVASLKLVTK